MDRQSPPRCCGVPQLLAVRLEQMLRVRLEGAQVHMSIEARFAEAVTSESKAGRVGLRASWHQ
eukprot:4625744-Prymnesium_polylepis.1